MQIFYKKHILPIKNESVYEFIFLNDKKYKVIEIFISGCKFMINKKQRFKYPDLTIGELKDFIKRKQYGKFLCNFLK